MTDEGTLNLIEAAEAAVRVAVTAQRETADPAHEQFYAWGGALSDILGRLAHVCDVLDAQIAHYGDRRVLRDDQEQDPSARLDEMVQLLARVKSSLASARTQADRFHNAASHIAVEVDPDAKDTTR